jgi:PAS domain S-box-containing protein
MAAEGKEDGRLRNKLALQRSEERFRQVVESAPNAIVMIGHTGLIEMVNAEAERVFGYTRNELLGKPVEMLVPERYRPKHPKLRTAFFADSVSRPMGTGRDLYGLRRDGSEFPVEIGLNSIQTEEGTMVLSAIVDISARKRLEERIHAINSVLTHEINQPLTAIVANAHAALRWLTNERPNFDEARAALKAIVSAGHRAGGIARSLHSTLKKGSRRDR